MYTEAAYGVLEACQLGEGINAGSIYIYLYIYIFIFIYIYIYITRYDTRAGLIYLPPPICPCPDQIYGPVSIY
jgi:hypothetical protein